MPYNIINVEEKIEQLKQSDSEFKTAWDNSQEEYRILMEIVALRKQKGMTQAEVAEATGIKQQALSRMENRDNSPTLRTICLILNKLGFQLEIKPITDGSLTIKSDIENQRQASSNFFAFDKECIGHKVQLSVSSSLRQNADFPLPNDFRKVDLAGPTSNDQPKRCVA